MILLGVYLVAMQKLFHLMVLNGFVFHLTVSFNELADIPEDLLDGDSDSLGVLSCDDGQIAVYSTEANGWIWEICQVLQMLMTEPESVLQMVAIPMNLETLQRLSIIITHLDLFQPNTSTMNLVINTITTFSIDLNITHPDMGEVTVELTSPEGETIIVYDGNHAMVRRKF